MKVNTEVTGEVREYHYCCGAAHEFSVLVRVDVEIDDVIDCPVLGCMYVASLLGENSAEISKNAADLITN